MTHLTRWQNFVVIDPVVQDGEPCVRGTEVPVRTILQELSSGSSIAEVLAAHPEVTPDQILAVLGYAADHSQERIRERLRQASRARRSPPSPRIED